MEKEKLTFKQWCELNGRRWGMERSYEEFSRNAADYERYLVEFIHDPKENE
tara:strand:- start:16389 stop:16541 length:153 start_codon:yes stop_codon:yes gene_type:complete